MKVEQNTRGLLGVVANEGRSTRSTQGATTKSVQEDSVRLSPLSVQLKSQSGDSEGIDSTRVAEIKQAISEGRFKVDASRVADGLIQRAREMLQSHKA